MRRTDQDTLTIHDLVHIADQITKHYLMRTVRERKRRVEGREGGREGEREGGWEGGKGRGRMGEREEGREGESPVFVRTTWLTLQTHMSEQQKWSPL